MFRVINNIDYNLDMLIYIRYNTLKAAFTHLSDGNAKYDPSNNYNNKIVLSLDIACLFIYASIPDDWQKWINGNIDTGETTNAKGENGHKPLLRFIRGDALEQCSV